LDDIKKYVIYDGRKPYIRAVFILGDRTAKNRQKIIEERLESDGRMDMREFLEARNLLQEFGRIELRGRPEGTGHPKRQVFGDLPIAPEDIDRCAKGVVTAR
jgi:hypothetical protein